VTTRVLAAGGVVARTADDGTHQIALIHRPKYDDWSLPKGKLLPGEAFEDAAVREVEEETGIRCALGPELGSVEYLDARGRPKLVRYFVMIPVADGGFVKTPEVDEVGWIPVSQAERLLTYERDRDIVRRYRP